MKATFRFAVILCSICLLAACQNPPTTTPEMVVDGNTEITTAPESSTQVSSINDFQTVKFYSKNSINDNQPLYWLYIKPIQPELATVDLLCDDSPFTISAGLDGILINNHCIIRTDQATAYAVLPDGTVISIAPNSSVQINLGERNKELILEKGEVFASVAPQGEERSFAVLAGDVSIETSDFFGTKFGVSLKDNEINVVAIDNEAHNLRCNKWGLEKCDEWEQLSTGIAPYEIYNTSIGGSEWTKVEEYNPWPNGEPAMPLAAEEGRELNQVFLITPFEPGVYEDDTNIAASREAMSKRILDLLEQLALDLEDYQLDVTALNESGDGYCTDYSSNCTDIDPTDAVAEGDSGDGDGGSSTSGGGATCGDNCPHEFDQSSCFTRSGHLWCFPTPGTVDITMSAEWDITAICASYPGETYCAWLK